VRHWFSPKFSVTVVAGLHAVTHESVCQVFTPSESIHCCCNCTISSCIGSVHYKSHPIKLWQTQLLPHLFTVFGTHNNFDGLWEWGIGSHPSSQLLLLPDCMLSSRNWCAKCLHQMNWSIATAIVLFPGTLVQSITRAISSIYNGPSCNLICWQCLALTITLMDFGSETLVLSQVLSYCCCWTACHHPQIGVPSVHSKWIDPLLLQLYYFQLHWFSPLQEPSHQPMMDSIATPSVSSVWHSQ